MLELVALLVALPLLALRRQRATVVTVQQPAILLPAMDVAPPRRRLARGSVEQRLTPLPEDLPRRAVIRPTHARR